MLARPLSSSRAFVALVPMLLLLCADPALAARISGRVLERGAVAPLPGVRVAAFHPAAGAAEGAPLIAGGVAETDARGRFDLLVPEGPVELQISSAAHQSQTVKLRASEGQRLEVEYRLVVRPRGPFQVTVRGTSPTSPALTLNAEELQTLPGSRGGEPFSVIGVLPGVTTPIPLLPIYVVRGSSVGMSGYLLDGMRLPQLFHLVVGGGVVHRRLIDHMDFYPSAYGAAFGRTAGAVAAAETRPARDGYHGEVQVRLFDVSALAEATLPGDVRVVAAGSYGYPGPLLKAIAGLDLNYWDYALRADWRGFMLEAIGSYDSVTVPKSSNVDGKPVQFDDELRLAFHHLQLRYRGRRGAPSGKGEPVRSTVIDYEAALVGGYDEMRIFGGAGVRKLFAGARASLKARLRRLQVAAGLDGELARFTEGGLPTADRLPDTLGELAGARDGLVGGAYAEGTLELVPGELLVTLGARVDAYHSRGLTVVGFDPRLSLRYMPTGWLTLRSGLGLYQQPPSFPVPLPGLDTFALQLGLQSAVHFATGVDLKLPLSISFGLTGYYQYYRNASEFNLNDFVLPNLTQNPLSAASPDTIVLFASLACAAPPPPQLSGTAAQAVRPVDGQSYGMEVSLQRESARTLFWVSYTMGRSERRFPCGLRPGDFDQPHALNLVAQVRLPWSLQAGARLFVQSGRPATALEAPDGRGTLRNNARLPTTVQLDLRLGREWTFRSFTLGAFLEVVNANFGELVLGLTYPTKNGVTNYDQPKANGFPWILPTFGISGRI